MGVIFVTSVFWETTMSNFNDANELASNLVFGTSYHNNKPMEGERPKQLSFHLTRRVTITADANTHEEWVKVAGWIEELFNEGFWLDQPNCPACSDTVDANFTADRAHLLMDGEPIKIDRSVPGNHGAPHTCTDNWIEDHSEESCAGCQGCGNIECLECYPDL